MENENKLAKQVVELANEALKSEGLTQSEISEKLGSRQTSISRFLNNRTNPTLNWAENFFSVLGYELDVKLKKKGK